ncbi:MAG: hypothetical protein Q9174_000233 [Haloplaca sp. 1 TL-2023]
MGIPIFDAWALSRVTKSMPITSLNGCVIGIDAAYYLGITTKEPLLSALGGFPYALESAIAKELNDLQAIGLKVHFVFDGLNHGMDYDPFGASMTSATNNAAAFDTYDKDLPNQAIQAFRTSGTPTPAALSTFLKKILHKNGIPFTVAPYSALAQLAYFEKHPCQFVDAIYGPSELFLYGVNKLITKFRHVHEPREGGERPGPKHMAPYAPEKSEFCWIDRGSCLEELGRIPSATFIDSLLLAGSEVLPAFPPLKRSSKGYSFREVVSLVANANGNIVSLCNQYPDDASFQRAEYLDHYKQAVTYIRHHVVITMEGDVETLDKEQAPSDVNDCVGQRLPEELNFYLSRGLVRPRVLNWLASGTILVPAPYDGGDSKVYQHLVQVDLENARNQALSLLADHLNRYYQRKEVTTKYWFDHSLVQKINIKDLLPSSPKESLASWNVKQEEISDRLRVLQKEIHNLTPCTISFAVQSLQDTVFAERSISPKGKSGRTVLKTRDEICANALWRFLQLHGYVDRQHRLTRWGNVLSRLLSTMGTNLEQENAAFLAVELLRYGLLNADTMFQKYSGAPSRGTDIDKRNCMLVARVACLGRLIHQPRGYSGPLSRHLLAYHSIVSAVQASARDLIEMSMVTMFLEGYVDRERDDWMELAQTLPLFNEDSCALGVIMLTYLDELCTREDPTSESTREEMKSRGQGWAVYCDFNASQQQALQLWDAVYQGVKLAKAGSQEVQEPKMWDEVDEWLSQRR